MAPRIDPEVGCIIPEPGQWPVDPQEDEPIREDRLWIDGCFDFFHHGHAGVMLQSRRLGNELMVGLHSDEEIAANKGPTVMNLDERVAAVNASRFSTACIPSSPYVTSIPWISHYGCQYVTHGDDITSDADGNDCYRFVKSAGRMKIVPRTPGISTTDLVGRMLTCSKDHFISSLADCLAGKEGSGDEAEREQRGKDMQTRLKEYAAAPNGHDPFVEIHSFTASGAADGSTKDLHSTTDGSNGLFAPVISGITPQSGQRLVYVDGGYDLFSSGHIAFLQIVSALEEELGQSKGWYTDAARQGRIQSTGADYGPAYIVAGIHDDAVINHYRGVNYPIMNIFERGLCVVQCAYIHAVIFGAPFVPSQTFLESMPFGQPPDAVYHGQTSFMPSPGLDPYADAKAIGIYQEAPPHAFANVNAAQIVQRIMDRRAEYEERQRKKGAKAVGEDVQWRREQLEREAEEARQKRVEASETLA